MNKITFEDLCGEHFLSGVEMGSEKIEHDFGAETCNVVLFTLDGVTYKLVENPDDGYRSYCDDIVTSESQPRFSFPPVKVLCSMMENDDYENNNCIVIRDAENGKTILEAGTKNYDDWYPYCHFRYTPENMACNQGREA